MGWGTDFKADVYLNKQIFTSNWEVRDRIRELEQDLAKQETLLISYACALPKDIAGEDWKDEPIVHINFLVDELLDTYKDDLYNKFQLELYLEFLDGKDPDKSLD